MVRKERRGEGDEEEKGKEEKEKEEERRETEGVCVCGLQRQTANPPVTDRQVNIPLDNQLVLHNADFGSGWDLWKRKLKTQLLC